ncbi:MAG: gamma-glutamyltransferase, partial [Hyphomicrobiales bacterium]|nr:gamma-glutamyltransferase [Hyphomicrobiales bacterium]
MRNHPSRIALLVAVALFLFSSVFVRAQQVADAIAPEVFTGITRNKLVKSKSWMVSTANPHASRAGRDIIEAGGNAIDAMVAIQLVLGLVEPQSSGLGGGAFLVYWDAKSANLTSFDGRETAPKSVDQNLFLQPD